MIGLVDRHRDRRHLRGPVAAGGREHSVVLLVDYYRLVAGEHPDCDDYRRAMEAERRVVLRIRPTRAGPDRTG